MNPEVEWCLEHSKHEPIPACYPIPTDPPESCLKTTPSTQMMWAFNPGPWYERILYRGKHVKRSWWPYLYIVVVIAVIVAVSLSGLVHL